MCVSPATLISPLGSLIGGHNGGGVGGLARSGMFGLAGLALGGRKKPDRNQILYPNDLQQTFGGGPNSNGSIS